MDGLVGGLQCTCRLDGSGDPEVAAATPRVGGSEWEDPGGEQTGEGTGSEVRLLQPALIPWRSR